MAILVVGLVLGAVSLAQDQEVVVGRFYIDLLPDADDFSAGLEIYSTGDISPFPMVYGSCSAMTSGGLRVDNSPQIRGPRRARITAGPFADLAESLRCTVLFKRCLIPWGPEILRFNVQFVRKGMRTELVPVIAELMKFVLRLPLE
jgi:hypothetical protein